MLIQNRNLKKALKRCVHRILLVNCKKGYPNILNLQKYWIAGLKHEINKFCNEDNDIYLRNFKNKIYKKPVSEVVKEHLINNTFFMYYCYRLLLVIKCDCRSAIYRYDGNFYLRHSCNTDKVMASDDEVLRMLTDNDRNCINRTLKHQWL